MSYVITKWDQEILTGFHSRFDKFRQVEAGDDHGDRPPVSFSQPLNYQGAIRVQRAIALGGGKDLQAYCKE